MSFAIGVAVGILFWPALLFAMGVTASLRQGAWTTLVGACPHNGPPGDIRWRQVWHCPMCGGRWWRRWVTRVLPIRVLWDRHDRERWEARKIGSGRHESRRRAAWVSSLGAGMRRLWRGGTHRSQ